MRIALSLGLVLWGSLGMGCGRNAASPPTREDCTRAAEHIAELIVDDYVAHADEWWDQMHAAPGDPGIAAEIQKGGFVAWLDTPPGKTWLLQRRGNTLSGVQNGIEPCMKNATKAQVECLVAAKSKDDVAACDAKRAPKLPPAAGSAAGSGTGSAGSSSTGSAETK